LSDHFHNWIDASGLPKVARQQMLDFASNHDAFDPKKNRGCRVNGDCHVGTTAVSSPATI
jgi:hypothetical protein